MKITELEKIIAKNKTIHPDFDSWQIGLKPSGINFLNDPEKNIMYINSDLFAPDPRYKRVEYLRSVKEMREEEEIDNEIREEVTKGEYTLERMAWEYFEKVQKDLTTANHIISYLKRVNSNIFREYKKTLLNNEEGECKNA